jgi:hypothetical protein
MRVSSGDKLWVEMENTSVAAWHPLWMQPRSVPVTAGATTLRATVGHVVCLCTEKQVIGTNTTAHITAVTHAQARRDWAMR